MDRIGSIGSWSIRNGPLSKGPGTLMTQREDTETRRPLINLIARLGGRRLLEANHRWGDAAGEDGHAGHRRHGLSPWGAFIRRAGPWHSNEGSAAGSRSRARSRCVRARPGSTTACRSTWGRSLSRFEQSDVRRRLVWTKIGRFKRKRVFGPSGLVVCR